MAVTVVPTLALMGEIYRLAPAERFDAYVALNRRGAPAARYNPMTTKDVLGTIEALLEVDAETIVREAASDVLGPGASVALSVAVATPGLWTDRVATEVDHRLGARTSTVVLLWTGEATDPTTVTREAMAQAMRIASHERVGPPRTVADAAAQEGAALAAAGERGEESAAAAEALDVVGDDEGLGAMAAFLYGDDVACQLGWTPLGLPPMAGYLHSTFVSSRRGSQPCQPTT